MDDTTLLDLFGSLSREVGSLRGQLKEGFSQVNQRLDRVDATLVLHGKQLADSVRVLSELAELRERVAKLEKPEAA